MRWMSMVSCTLALGGGVSTPPVLTEAPSVDVVVLASEPVADTITQFGERLATVQVTSNGDDLARTLTTKATGEVPHESVDLSLPPVPLQVDLPDGTRRTFQGTGMNLRTLPIVNEFHLVAGWAQVLSWISGTDGNDDAATATLTLIRFDDGPWSVGNGTIELPSGEYLIELDIKAGVTYIHDAPQLGRLESGDDAVIGDPAGGERTPIAAPGRVPDGPRNESVPPSGTVIDVLGVAATGLTPNSVVVYLAGGVNDMNAALQNSSSAGYATGNGSMRLVAVISVAYTQAGLSDVDLLNLEAGSVGLSAAAVARNLVAADLVTLVVPNPLTATTCGQGRQYGWASVITIESNEDCASRKTVAHELGHNLGSGHAPGQVGAYLVPGYSDTQAYEHSSSRCTVVNGGPNTACRKLIYSTPQRVLPGTGTAAGNSTQFNAHIVSDRIPLAAAYKTAGVAADGTYVQVSPTRILDSRPNTSVGGYTTPWPANEERPVSVAGTSGVPSYASAVAVSITVTNPASVGWLAAYPYGTLWPGNSTTNYVVGQTRAATAIVKLGTYGMITIKSWAQTDVIIDVLGYFGSGTSANKLSLVAPARVLDAPIASGGVTTPVVLSPPAGLGAVAAAVVNITVVSDGVHDGYASVSGPAISMLNWIGPATVANLAFAPMSGNTISIYTLSPVAHLIVDVLGYLSADGAWKFTAAAPWRANGGTSIGPGGFASTTVSTTPGAVILNLTGTGTAPTYLTAFAAGQSLPGTSTLNIQAADSTNANHTIVATGTGNQVTVYNLDGTVVHIIDVEGNFGP